MGPQVQRLDPQSGVEALVVTHDGSVGARGSGSGSGSDVVMVVTNRRHP